MVSRSILTDFLIVIVLVLLQIVLFNNMKIMGIYTPVFFPVFVLFYPFYRNAYVFVGFSFLLGLAIDAFMGSWGNNAFATCFIAYFRILIFKNTSQNSNNSYSLQAMQWSQFVAFIFSSLFVHQFIVQYLEFFKFSRFWDILWHICITSIVSFVFVILYSLLFKLKQKT